MAYFRRFCISNRAVLICALISYTVRTMRKIRFMKKDGFEAIWRPAAGGNSGILDIYELDQSSAPYLIGNKQFTNARVAESYFMDKVGKRPSDGLQSTLQESDNGESQD